jgi:hypothetical protein
MKKAFWVLLVVSCAHAPQKAEVQVDVASYYPLQVGNSWTYDVNLLGAHQKQEISIVGAQGGRFTDSAGNTLSVDAYGIRDEKRYLLRTPIAVGTRWNNVVSVSSYEQYEIIEAGHSCEAPAGTFVGCVVVQSRNKAEGEKTLINTMTFAPRVGLVRVATEMDVGGKLIPQARLELVSYKVGQGGTPDAG